MKHRFFFRLALLGAVMACSLSPSPASAQTPTYLMQWGSLGSGPGQFTYPYQIALDQSGNLYVADTYNNRIQVFSSSGAYLREWGSSGTAAGQFRLPQGVAVGPNGDVYVVDTVNNRIEVFSSTGAFIREWGSYGTAPGYLIAPHEIAVDAAGKVYVTEQNRVQVFTSDGSFLTTWGSEGTDGGGTFYNAWGIVVDGNGTVYVSDFMTQLIQAFTTSGVFLRQWQALDTGYPIGLALDAAGNVYVPDDCWVQEFSASGALLTQWGGCGNGNGQLQRPHGIAVATNGQVYVADTYNHRIEVFGPAATPTVTRSWGYMKAIYR